MYSFDRSLKNLFYATFVLVAFTIVVFTTATLSIDKQYREKEVIASFNQTATIFITISFILILVIYIFLMKLYKKIDSPIQNLVKETNLLLAGNYNAQINNEIIANSPMEYQKLCYKFNELSNSMKTNMLSLKNTEREAEQVLSSMQNRFRTAFENSGVGIVLGTREGEFVYLNPAFAKLLSYEESELIELGFSQISHPDDLQKDKQLFEKLQAKKIAKYQVEKRYYRKDRSIIWVNLTISNVELPSSDEEYYLAMVEDITEKKDAEKALRRSEQHLSDVVEMIPSGILISDTFGKITFANSMATDTLGLDGKKLLTGMYNIANFEVRTITGEPLRKSDLFLKYVIKKRKHLRNFELRILKLDGKFVPISLNATPLIEDGQVTGILAAIVDISERIETEQKLKKANAILEEISMKDELTEIANRRQFNDVFKREWASHLRSAKDLSIIIFDIDHFKEFNDTYGHQFGDECLKLVANAAQKCLKRTGDFVARYGGEEFIIILPETDLVGALHVGEKIRKQIEKLAITHRSSKVASVVTISAGVATSFVNNHFSTPEEIIGKADKELYKAKISGRNKVGDYPVSYRIVGASL